MSLGEGLLLLDFCNELVPLLLEIVVLPVELADCTPYTSALFELLMA
jgi:hypothetical protein